MLFGPNYLISGTIIYFGLGNHGKNYDTNGTINRESLGSSGIYFFFLEDRQKWENTNNTELNPHILIFHFGWLHQDRSCYETMLSDYYQGDQTDFRTMDLSATSGASVIAKT